MEDRAGGAAPDGGSGEGGGSPGVDDLPDGAGDGDPADDRASNATDEDVEAPEEDGLFGDGAFDEDTLFAEVFAEGAPRGDEGGERADPPPVPPEGGAGSSGDVAAVPLPALAPRAKAKSRAGKSMFVL